MKVYIYNENCVSSGRSVPEQELERYEDPKDGGDWTEYEGSGEELLEVADAMENGRPSPHRMRVARSIREAVYWDRVDLAPEGFPSDW